MKWANCGRQILRRAALFIVLSISVFLGSSLAAEPVLLRATAVYSVIATDPLYLWIAQEKGLFRKNGVEIDLTHIPTNQAV